MPNAMIEQIEKTQKLIISILNNENIDVNALTSNTDAEKIKNFIDLIDNQAEQLQEDREVLSLCGAK